MFQSVRSSTDMAGPEMDRPRGRRTAQLIGSNRPTAARRPSTLDEEVNGRKATGVQLDIISQHVTVAAMASLKRQSCSKESLTEPNQLSNFHPRGNSRRHLGQIDRREEQTRANGLQWKRKTKKP